jgi:hypothetical protein
VEYVDGFLIPVPRANKDAYRDLAARAAAVLREHGATRWTFTEIKPDSFHWLGEALEPDGKIWRLEGEFRAVRMWRVLPEQNRR